ncbi:uncharacterized protein LOC123215068 [Mangifera indica]|uniref:uncharacterized protein LOC123215068 n=1 Tax=Mangifera indica TaxID=29780 RepID=UPI001CFBE717|nr:uncharacterized protein LOC123215068 [Mangifera indica]
MRLHTILNSSPSMFLLFSRSNTASLRRPTAVNFTINKALFSSRQQISMRSTCCGARRRVRYEEDEEEYEHNEEIAMLEIYTQSARGEALLVKALVDEREEEVLIFRGFSSSLSGRTSPDPSKSVVPARAVIKSIDRIKGPFDPSNIEYIEKHIQWKAFKPRLPPLP